ncbi:MAG: FecR domain-containing protein, partial [Caldilineaceae bacterium]|nr:FecR domain-containing protein [Caldilineaceae bacterium]
MRDRALSARVLYRAVALLLLCALVLPPSPSLKAAPVKLSSSVTQLVDSFAATLNSNQSQQRKAAIAILQHYNEYKSLVATGKVDKSVARVLDEHLVQMCQETWRDVAVRQGSGLDHIVPVGTLGNRWENPAYIPGKSDKDFIPRGRSASEAVGDFNQVFEQRFGLSPASVDVNVLDPTDPSSWPGRYSAATNVEKYNTAGGNKWLAAEEYLQKPNLWRFDPASGTMREVYYEGVVKTPPPALTKGDALGWYSDNTRFRALLGDKVVEPELLALKQAKYDLRNADAFRLAGGTLSESDAAMLRATQLLRNGKPDAALGVMIQLTGETNPQRALAAYLRSMDELNSTMGRFIADSHVRLLSSSLANSKLTLQLTNEMAASIANLPRTQRVAAVEALVERFGKSKADEIVKLADVFERRAAWGLTYFDDAAMASFGKRYDQLTGAERAVLHGADEVAESFLSKAARVTGYVFSGYAIYNAYVQGAKHGTGTGIGSAIGRAFIEALQAGVPIVAIGELVAQLTAGAVQLGAAAYKNDVLESLYDLYKKEQNLDFLLDIQGALPYYSGGLRQLAIDLKMENPNITEAEIRQQIGDYFARRLQAEQAAEAMKARVQNLLDWLHARDIELVDATNVDGLSAEESQLIAGLLEAYQRLEEQFRRDGILANDENILAALWHLYHRAGTPESYEKFLRELYRGFGKRYPPAGQPRQCKDKPVIQTSRSATVIRAQAPQKTGQLLSVSGSFTERVDVACDPAPVVAPVEISAGGRISITVDGGSPVPCTWSIWNAGAGLAVDYIPQIGRNQGPAQRIAETSLTCESGEPSNTHVEMGGDVPGPGQLVAHVAVPGGCGALTCGCFEQSFSGQVTMVEVRADAAAQPGTELDNGDRVVTGDNGTTRLIVPGFASVTIRKNSDLTYVDTAASESQAQATCGGAPALTLNQGSLRLRTVPGGQPMAVQVSGRTVLPEGTDYVVEATATGGRVTVFTGAVTIEDSDGKTVTVLAGQSFEWPGDVMSDAQIRAEDVASEEAPYADLLLDDTTPAPYGDWPATFSGEQMPAQWVWSDPGQDATWTSPEPDTIQVTAPDGNALWSQQATAPLLLRKVTGD